MLLPITKSAPHWSIVVLLLAWLAAGMAQAAPPGTAADEKIDIGSRRELFVDHFLIGQLQGARLVLHAPEDRGIVLEYDKPWEGRFSGYTTVLRDGDTYRLFYRGVPEAGQDGNAGEVTCTALSPDGIHWTKPELGLFEVRGTKANNVILSGMAPLTHNFSPMLDARPGVPAEERFKALGGTRHSGLVAFVSADGLRWRKLRQQAVIREGALDSQNVAFWSEAEGCYVCYLRTFVKNVRWISRTTSKDFLTWTPIEQMTFERPGGPAPPEHLYINQTHPYFRAGHLYVATAARFMPGRQVISDEQAKAIGVHPGYFRDCSDAVLLTSRGGTRYDRTFMESFVRPGIGLENWVSRSNYPALGIVQTGPTEMSLYVNNNYGQPTARLRRYAMRLDGLASVQAPYDGGQMVSRPLVFAGKRLRLNFATSAAGGIRVQIEQPDGTPVPGFTLNDAAELIGNEIERAVSWKGSEDVGSLAGKPVRLRFVMKDADLYAMRFE